jgi:hypothetical protein
MEEFDMNQQQREIPEDLIHVEGTMDTGEHITFDVPSPNTCTKIRELLGFFDINPIRSSCTDGCDGCGPSIDAAKLVCF